MISRRKLNHTAAGLLDKFVGRYNDHEGYWALGVLYKEARISANRVEIDMLDASVQPASPICTDLARTWASCLRQAIDRHGIPTHDLAAASISIEFGLPAVPTPPGLVAWGDPFPVHLAPRIRDGRVSTRQKSGHCRPSDQFPGRRSGRYTG
ncbi:hypothetical protein [Massilia consociata]|uniref:Uncharacterized protein n=1 Tax=Massilia consociata TaxID=760117 RepID=A0ABV6FKC3_9BURK